MSMGSAMGGGGSGGMPGGDMLSGMMSAFGMNGPVAPANNMYSGAATGSGVVSKARSQPIAMDAPMFGPGSGMDTLRLGTFSAQAPLKPRNTGGVLSTVPVMPTQFQPTTNDLSQFQGQILNGGIPNYLLR